MAKKAPKETSTPLIIALVFFVLTTIAFGVMWYMQFSDQEAKAEAVAKEIKATKAATALTKEAELNAKLYRIYLGIDEGTDKTDVKGEHKAGDKLSTELKKINDAVAKKLGFDDASKLPEEWKVWAVDEKGMIADPPAKGVLEPVGKLLTDRDTAITEQEKSSKLYKDAVAQIDVQIKSNKASEQKFNDLTKVLPKEFDDKIKDVLKAYNKRMDGFTAAEKASRDEINNQLEAIGKLERDKTLLDKEVASLLEKSNGLIRQLTKKADTFQYDEPQGKILRRLPEGIIEINLGSASLVRPGLTFTVLPSDFPEKGRQSRVLAIRVANERGEYKTVQRFVEKATIEVIEVVGANLSRCRVTQEYDPIRDGAAPGDLLYNSVWRKGTADHIALLGIFDINGDGTDDIEAVIRDLTRMGIPVDAYFDMKTRKWVGTITEQTRFVIEGWYPNQGAQDPNRDDKTRLLGEMQKAIKFAQEKGVGAVKFQDFFPRMGYKAKIDVPADKINQATAPYLNKVAAGESPVKP